MIDTIRILLFWECNLKCPYCCNENEHIKQQISTVDFDSIRFHVWENYKNLNLEQIHPKANFRYWKMDDCDRENEDRVVLRYMETNHG